MGELVTLDGTKQLKLTEQDFRSLVIARLAELSGTGFDPIVQVEHDFCNGMYARTLILKKGQIVIGAPHSQESFLTVRKGHSLIANGNEVLDVEAGFQTVLGVGKMCLCVALEDTTFTNYSPNPNNLTAQDDLWKINTFSISDDLWATVDQHILTLIQAVQKQEIEQCRGA